jgi:hypothetical protein
MGYLLKLKCAHSPLNPRILSSASVSFTITTVQVPNLALTHTKRITVKASSAEDSKWFQFVPERHVSDVPSLGRPRDTSTKYASSKEHIVQGKEHPRLFVRGHIVRGQIGQGHFITSSATPSLSFLFFDEMKMKRE